MEIYVTKGGKTAVMEKPQNKGKNGLSEFPTQTVLEKELEILKRKLSLNDKLRVKWMPDQSNNLSGEIKDLTVFIYESTTDQASLTLVHELVDYCVSQAIEPYKEVTNILIKFINREAYKKKEKIVETISMLLLEDN
jgi:hypothetical protein